MAARCLRNTGRFTGEVLVTLDKKVLPAGFPADKYFLTRPYDRHGAQSAELVKARMGIEG